MHTAAPRASLRTLLGDHPVSHALRRGMVTSPTVSLDFADVAVPNRAFKRVVRDLEFDVAELALMTFLMARSRGVPLRLLPVVLFSRNPLPHLICDGSRDRLEPGDLAGRRIGVRSYSTTTAVWIRAILADCFTVDLHAIEWIALDEGHVAGVADPPNVHRAPLDADLVAMLRDGAVDAAVVDRVPQEPVFATVISQPAATIDQWQKAHNARTLNHVVVVRESIAGEEGLMREVFRLFGESRAAARDVDSSAAPIGLEANRRNLDVAIAVASGQGLLAGPLTVDDLVTEALASLQ